MFDILFLINLFTNNAQCRFEESVATLLSFHYILQELHCSFLQIFSNGL